MDTKTTENEELHFLRGQLGVSLSEMARFFGVSRNTYAKWERGDSQPNELIRAAIHAAVRLSDLLTSVPDVEVFLIALGPRYVGQPPGDLSLLSEEQGYLRSLPDLRHTLAWSQTDLAKFVGVSQSTVTTWEQPGAGLPTAVVRGLLALLDVEFRYRRTRLRWEQAPAYLALLLSAGGPEFIRQTADGTWNQYVADHLTPPSNEPYLLRTQLSS